MDPSKKYPRGFERRTRVAFDRLEDVPQAGGLYVWKFDGVDGLEHWTYHYGGRRRTCTPTWRVSSPADRNAASCAKS